MILAAAFELFAGVADSRASSAALARLYMNVERAFPKSRNATPDVSSDTPATFGVIGWQSNSTKL
jgi:hypothetical protein